jgi:hypothetical protein
MFKTVKMCHLGEISGIFRVKPRDSTWLWVKSSKTLDSGGGGG